MALDQEKKMIRDSLDELRRVKDFEKVLNSPPGMMAQFVIDNAGKNVDGAEEFRRQGNGLFTKETHDVCMHYRILSRYNQSLVIAPANTESLACAYGNRSSILEHIGRYQESIASLDKALSITKTPSLKVKLLCRKARCEATLCLSDGSKHLEQARSWLNKFKGERRIKDSLADTIERSEMLAEERIQNIYPLEVDVKSQDISELISKAEAESDNSVELVHSEKYGRHLIAARDIKPGEILVIEKAFSTDLNPDHGYLYCWHCSSFLWEIVPCDSCAGCLYCSEQCKTESWRQYHEIECRISTSTEINYTSLCGLISERVPSPLSNGLGFRIFLMALKEAGSMRDLRASLDSFDKCKGDSQIADLPSDDYRHIYALPSNVGKTTLDDIVRDTALHLVALAKYSSIFNDVHDSRKCSLKKLMSNEDILFAGALMVKFCAISDTHCLENTRRRDCNKIEPCGFVACGEISCSIGLKTSLTRRGCVPNVKRCLVGRNQIILYSILPIKKGTPIFDSHLSVFENTTPKLERQMAFCERYGFSCECEACEDNWPVFNLYCGASKYYNEVQFSLPEKGRRVFEDLLRIFEEKDLSAVSVLSKFPDLMERSMREFPLPSKTTAFIIHSLICVIENSYGFCKPQVTDKCCT